MAMSPADCNNCILPLDELLKKIRTLNSTVPIYIISENELSPMEKVLFENKLGIGLMNIQLVAHPGVYEYLISKKDGIPSICYVSETSKIICLKNLKDDGLEKFFDFISPEFEIHLEKKIELQNPYISSYRAYANSFIEQVNTKSILYSQYNLVSQYDLSGLNTKNLFIDSLNINYQELAKSIFSPEDYESSMQHLQKLKKSKKSNELISPISIVKINDDTFALASKIYSFKDTIYKNEAAIFEDTYTCLLLLNKELQYIGYLKFNKADAQRIEPYCHVSTVGSSFFFLKYNKPRDNYFLAEYKIVHDSLQHISQYEEPYRPKKSEILQYICPHTSDPNSIFITYNADNDKYVHVYRFDLITKRFNLIIHERHMNINGNTIYQTKKGNYIFIAKKPHKSYSVHGYDSRKQKFVNATDQKVENNQKQNSGIKLGLNNDFLQLTYSE
jgi:hypothetical protein